MVVVVVIWRQLDAVEWSLIVAVAAAAVICSEVTRIGGDGMNDLLQEGFCC